MSTVSVELSKLAPKLSGNLKINRKKQAVNNLVAVLFDTVRMSEWEYIEPDTARTHNGVGASGGFKLDSEKKLSVWVTPELVEVRKGIRKFPIGNGKDAAMLFNNLRHVKAVVAKAQSEHLAGESSVNALLSEALDDITNGNDAVTADEFTEDIHIPNASTLVDPIEVTSESEEVAGALENEMIREDDPLTRTKEALEASENELGAALFGSDDPEDDVFADALGVGVAKKSIRRVDNSTSISEGLRPGTFGSLQSLQGRVLGIVEAAFADKTQREAVKTLIRKEFRREMNKVGGSHEN